MVIFGKKNDVLDLTDLQRRGILKKGAEIEGEANSFVDVSQASPSVPTNNSGGDLLSSVFGASSSSSVSSAEGPDVPNPLGFMDSSPKEESSGSFWDVGSSSSNEETKTESVADSLEVQGLKNKVEDLEYKIDRLMERIAELEKN